VVLAVTDPLLALRRADRVEDVDLLLGWRNDAETRAASFTTEIVARAQHEAWVARRLADPACSLLIAEDDEGPIGVVRIERTADGGGEIHLTIAPGRRGQGFARRVFVAALAHARERGLHHLAAAVHPANERSLRALLAVGYVEIARTAERVDLRAELSSGAP
jgi:RimJ/RimL family protein N-acetyltransferase